jgi:hypothetical protein
VGPELEHEDAVGVLDVVHLGQPLLELSLRTKRTSGSARHET